jgi:hypothetical protein
LLIGSLREVCENDKFYQRGELALKKFEGV